jgi:hypothetical protein
MSNTGTYPVIDNMAEDFMLVQGQHSTMKCLGIRVPKYALLAKVCNRIRYDCLIEGKILKCWLETIRPMLKKSGQRISS